MMKKYLLLLLIAQVIFSGACKKKNYDGLAGPQGSAGAAGAPYYGVIAGHISLYDEDGLEQREHLDSVSVRLNDSVSTRTDANGYYAFGHVAIGTYNISFSKNGFGATMVTNATLIKDTLYTNAKMSAKPDFDVLTFNAYLGYPGFLLPSKTVDSLIASFLVSTKMRNCIIFVSNNRSVSASNYLLAYTKSILPNYQTVLRTMIPDYELHNANIFYGETAYYAIYSYVVNDASVYADPHTGKKIYTAVGNPIIDSAIAP